MILFCYTEDRCTDGAEGGQKIGLHLHTPALVSIAHRWQTFKVIPYDQNPTHKGTSKTLASSFPLKLSFRPPPTASLSSLHILKKGRLKEKKFIVTRGVRGFIPQPLASLFMDGSDRTVQWSICFPHGGQEACKRKQEIKNSLKAHIQLLLSSKDVHLLKFPLSSCNTGGYLSHTSAFGECFNPNNTLLLMNYV